MSFQALQDGSRSSLSSSKSTSQAVAGGIFQINTAVPAFRRLVDAIGTSKDTPDHRQKLHNARQRILQLVKDTSAKVKTLSESDRHADVHASKKIEDAKLARDFQTVLREFQKVQQLASERESIYSPSSLAPSTTATTTDNSGSAEYVISENHPFLREQKRQVTLLLDNEIAFNEAIIEERAQGFREIEDQIGQANEIFKDLAVLVHEQDVVIDDISSNIESSSAATTHAKAQLAKASKNVKSRSTWCWWVLAIIVLALVMFFLILIL